MVKDGGWRDPPLLLTGDTQGGACQESLPAGLVVAPSQPRGRGRGDHPCRPLVSVTASPRDQHAASWVSTVAHGSVWHQTSVTMTWWQATISLRRSRYASVRVGPDLASSVITSPVAQTT
jgi:hypothetical protein